MIIAYTINAYLADMLVDRPADLNSGSVALNLNMHPI